MPTPTKTTARTQAMYELEALQNDLFINWIDQSLPDTWNGFDIDDPVEPHKTRVTLRMDSDMLAWFRKLGPGYQKRINRVVRVYWLSLLCGHIEGYPSDNVLPRLEMEARRLQKEIRAQRAG
ncbi:BrnA antitoxin family protein [uncultured Tateyamaria sp.]|uniref:BrnA antitoxin family protein n=1 Tax=uncultured Tateyamaria sp. TaxID=455651 RepID=UPI0026281897|nr:BrnA antitoxin family protein [uncultured Tateyamaria sp.]